MKDKSHRRLREQTGAYTLGQLGDERSGEVRSHLETCATCRTDLNEIAPVAALLVMVRTQLRPERLTGLGGGPGPPPPLSPELIMQVRAASHRPRSIDTAHSQRFSGPRWLPAAAAAAVVAVAGLGIGFVAGAAGDGPGVTEAVAVRVLDPGIRAEADLVAHTWGTEVKLTATGFEPSTTYRVTVVSDHGRTVDAGEFIGTGDTQMRCNLNSSVLRADASSVQVAGPDGTVVLDATV